PVARMSVVEGGSDGVGGWRTRQPATGPRSGASCRVSRRGRSPVGFPPRRFFFLDSASRSQPPGTGAMDKSDSAVAEQIARTDQSHPTIAERLARAASAFERRLTGHPPKSLTVVLSGETLVITIHGVLSRAARRLVQGL